MPSVILDVLRIDLFNVYREARVGFRPFLTMCAGVRKTSVRNCPAVHRPAFRRVPIGGRQKTITSGETQRCAATLEDMTDRVVIAGGGIAGLATAAALTQARHWSVISTGVGFGIV